ncbi:MAG: transposase family protein, partial [Prevotellaceae bacterium]|nr:transposase family protein [Prevotellaceae bacterium]
RHTVKNAVIISVCCTVLFVSQTVAGRIHDKAIADMAYNIPSGFTLYQDTGYQGYSPDGVRIMQPYKKPKGGELTRRKRKHGTMNVGCIKMTLSVLYSQPVLLCTISGC